MTFTSLYGEQAPPVLTEQQMELYRDIYSHLSDEELLTMVCASEAVQ